MKLSILFESGAKMEIPIKKGYENRLNVTTMKDGRRGGSITDITYGDGESAVLYVDYSKVICVCLVKE
jgi:hypothetical protein